MVAVSCSGKFHAFALAEQLERHGKLAKLFTTYASQKNVRMRRFAGREDKEIIPAEKIATAIPLAVGIRLCPAHHFWNGLFDRQVARRLGKLSDFEVFIGWSGMSLRSLRVAKQLGKLTIIERGSAHIRYQDLLLREEYDKFGHSFRIDPRTIRQEEQEYAEADYISIPSFFAKQSFLDYGFPEEKLLLNPYGSSAFFQPVDAASEARPLRVVYLGNLSFQKGLIYLFEALDQLEREGIKPEAWFIGKVGGELRTVVEKHSRPHWKFWGHINHYDLPDYLSRCDIGVLPSIQDGFGMVIPQMLSCGLPVIASTNTGAENVIKHGMNGFIVPIRSPEAIANHLRLLLTDAQRLQQMKRSAREERLIELSWEAYGNRYVEALERCLSADCIK